MSDTPEELQAKLDKALASIEKLEAKNKEIIEEKKKASADADAAREAAEAAEEERARSTKDVEALEKQITKKFEKQLADLTKANKGYEEQLSTLLIDNAIQANLSKHNVSPAFHKALTAMLKTEAKLADGAAVIGGVGIEDHIAAYVASDEGKVFVAAPANAGAGATGSKMGAIDTTPSEWNFTHYVKMSESNPAGAREYAMKHGHPVSE